MILLAFKFVTVRQHATCQSVAGVLSVAVELGTHVWISDWITVNVGVNVISRREFNLQCTSHIEIGLGRIQ